MESQHFIACSGVIAAPQSKEYTARATTRATNTIGFTTRILAKLRKWRAQVKSGPAAALCPFPARRPIPAHGPTRICDQSLNTETNFMY